MSEKDIQHVYAEIRNLLSEGTGGGANKPLSVRFSEETAREIEAEARLTRRTASDVIKDRMIYGLMPEAERDPHMSYRRRCLMPGIVEMTNDGLLERVKFLSSLVERAKANKNEPQQHLCEELRLYQTEIELRRSEARKRKLDVILYVAGDKL